jgi:hypothetical protein
MSEEQNNPIKTKSGYVCQHDSIGYRRTLGISVAGPIEYCGFCGSIRESVELLGGGVRRQWVGPACHRPGLDPDQCESCEGRHPERDLEVTETDGPLLCPRCREEGDSATETTEGDVSRKAAKAQR